MADGTEIMDAAVAAAAAGTSFQHTDHGCKLLWRPATSLDNSMVKGVVYEKIGKASFVSEKRKRNHLVAHVTSGKDDEPPIKSSDIGKEVTLRPKENENRCPVTNPPSCDDNLYVAKEVAPEHHPRNKDQNSKFLMEIPNSEIPPDSPRTLIPNVKHMAPRMRKSSNLIARAIRGVAVAFPKKYHKQDTSSSRSATFSITACMEELKKYSDIPVLKRVKATKELQNKNWRETFICMDDEMRRAWMESLE